jgi:hypothetical protein
MLARDTPHSPTATPEKPRSITGSDALVNSGLRFQLRPRNSHELRGLLLINILPDAYLSINVSTSGGLPTNGSA